MAARALLLLLAAGALGLAEEEAGIEQPPVSPHAKRLREEAEKLWAPHAELAETLKRGQAVDPAALAAARDDFAEAVLRFERSLQLEWNRAANDTLAEVVRAWFRARAALAAGAGPDADPAPADRKAQLRDARRFLMDWAKARKYESQFRRCDRCNGQKDLVSHFGDRTACPRCQRQGFLHVPKGILDAHWLPRSPVYRAHARNLSEIDRKLRFAARSPARYLAPYIRTVAIDSLDDQGLFVRVKVKEQLVPDPASPKTEKADAEYVIFNIGKIWYLYTPQSDRELFTLPEPEEKEEKKE